MTAKTQPPNFNCDYDDSDTRSSPHFINNINKHTKTSKLNTKFKPNTKAKLLGPKKRITIVRSSSEKSPSITNHYPSYPLITTPQLTENNSHLLLITIYILIPLITPLLVTPNFLHCHPLPIYFFPLPQKILFLATPLRSPPYTRYGNQLTFILQLHHQ